MADGWVNHVRIDNTRLFSSGGTCCYHMCRFCFDTVVAINGPKDGHVDGMLAVSDRFAQLGLSQGQERVSVASHL